MFKVHFKKTRRKDFTLIVSTDILCFLRNSTNLKVDRKNFAGKALAILFHFVIQNQDFVTLAWFRMVETYYTPVSIIAVYF